MLRRHFHLTFVLFFSLSVALGYVGPSAHHQNQLWPGETALEVRYHGDSRTGLSAREEAEPIPGMFYKLLMDYYPKNLGGIALGPNQELNQDPDSNHDSQSFWVAILTSPENSSAHPQFPVARYMTMKNHNWVLVKFLAWKRDLVKHPDPKMQEIFSLHRYIMHKLLRDFGFIALPTPVIIRPVKYNYREVKWSGRIKTPCIKKYGYIGSNVLFIMSAAKNDLVRVAFLSTPDVHLEGPKAREHIPPPNTFTGPSILYADYLRSESIDIVFFAKTVNWEDIEGYEIGCAEDIYIGMRSGRALGKYFNDKLGRFSGENCLT